MSVFRQWPIYLLGRILPAALSFAGIALYTRLLEPSAFGLFALLMSTSYLVGVFGYSWLRVAVLRMLASLSEDDEPDHMATIATLFVAASCGVVITIVVVIYVTNPRLPISLYAITALGTVVANWFELNVTIVQARMKLVSYGILQGARAIVAMIATLVLIRSGFTVAALLGGYAVGSAVAFACAGNWRPALRGRFRRAIFVRFVSFGWSASLNSVSQVADTFQRFLLTIAGGSAALGICSAAASISEKTIGILVGTTALAGQPLTFRARDLGASEQLKAQITHNARLIFTVGIGAAVGIIALSGSIASVYLGEKFRQDAQPIIIMAACTMLVGSFRTYYFEQIFEIAFAMRPIAILIVMRTLLTIAFGVALIPRFGALGMVGSGLLTELVSCTITAFWARRHISVPLPIASFLKTTLAAVAMIVCVHAIPHRDTVTGLIVSLVFAGLAFGTVHVAFYRRQLGSLIRIPRRFQSSGTTP